MKRINVYFDTDFYVQIILMEMNNKLSRSIWDDIFKITYKELNI